MRAAIRRRYGPPEGVEIVDLPEPTYGDDEVLLRVRAASVNASDWEFLTGSPAYVRAWGLFEPKYKVLGSDVAGEVVAVGKSVTRFKVGDAVLGDILGRWGGFAELACAPERALVHKPGGVTFAQAATLPQAALVALQGLEDAGRLASGQKVLINGAGGGTGSFALQFARAKGAEVTGVDEGSKLSLMRELGADHVIDYTREDFTRSGRRYDLVLDLVARRSVFSGLRALTPGGRYVVVGGSLGRILEFALLGSLLSLTGKRLRVLAAEANKQLAQVAEQVAAGTLVPVIERSYPLDETAQALAHVGEGRARGKIVVTVAGSTALQ